MNNPIKYAGMVYQGLMNGGSLFRRVAMGLVWGLWTVTSASWYDVSPMQVKIAT
jgi:hypothetical protein